MPDASLNPLKYLRSGEQGDAAHPGAQERKTHHLSADRDHSDRRLTSINMHPRSSISICNARSCRVMPSPKAFEPYRTD
jgi:hypothetical protein